MAKEMKSRDLNLTGLVKATSIPKSTLSDWMNGRLPSSRNLHHLANLSHFFEISLNELLFGAEKKITSNEILFSSSFKDGKKSYRVIVEKIEN